MGDDIETVELTQQGLIDIVVPTVSKMGNWDPAFNAPELPYVFPNRETAVGVLQGDFGNMLFERASDLDLKGIGWMENGFRHATNTKRPITQPSDFKGIKLRTMPVEAHMTAFKSFCANPTPMAFSELYSALQQKVVDGQENPVSNIYNNRMYEVQDYVSLTGHVYSTYIVLMSQMKHDSLSEDERKVVLTAMDNVYKLQLDIINKEETEQLEFIKSKGVKVNQLSNVEMQAFIDETAKLSGYFSDLVGDDVYGLLTSEVKSYTN